MARSIAGAECAETRRCVMRALLAVSAVWLTFWALIAGVFITAAGPTMSLAWDFPFLCLLVFTPPLTLLAAGLLGVEALARLGLAAPRPQVRVSRDIRIELD